MANKNGELLRQSDPLKLDHANNITYNPDIDRLVISHCQSPDDHYNRCSFVDPKTLTITDTMDKSQPFFSMAYSSEKKQYASARWSGETLDFWDKDMNHLMAKDVKMPETLSQGVFCDGKGVYFVRSSLNGHKSEILIYDWNGELKHTVMLALPAAFEPESINIADGTTYVMADDGSGNAIVYATPDNLIPKDCQILIDEFPVGDIIGDMRLHATESSWNDRTFAFADSEMYQKVTGVHDVYIINGTSGNFAVRGIKLSGVWKDNDESVTSSTTTTTSKKTTHNSTTATTTGTKAESTEGENNENDKSPDTGVTGSVAVVALAVAACAAVTITRKKK